MATDEELYGAISERWTETGLETIDKKNTGQIR